ncbi:MAG: hypothetical protein HND58_15940 [Planctomycetota bacterium]|nr:MAG: hypothetical protein HND58_15940 [Planctomycetota bacterium]
MLTAKTSLIILGILLCAMAAIPARRNAALCFLRAIGLLALVALPVGIAQFLWVIEAQEFPELILGPIAAVPFNMGGLLCAAAFDSVDRAGLIPPRQVTVHMGVYLPILIAQTTVLAAIIAGAHPYHRTRPRRPHHPHGAGHRPSQLRPRHHLAVVGELMHA